GRIHVGLTNGLTEIAIGHLDAPLPPCSQFLLAGENSALEVEVLFDKAPGQSGSFGLNQVPTEVALPIAERDCSDRRVHFFENFRIADVQLLEVGESRILEKPTELKVGSQPGQLIDVNLVIA